MSMSAKYASMTSEEAGTTKLRPEPVEVQVKSGEKPKTFGLWILSVIGCFCCLPLGVAAVVLIGQYTRVIP